MYRDGNTDQNKLVVAVADSGEGPGGRCPPPRLFLNQGQKKFFWRPGPPFSKGLDDWHCVVVASIQRTVNLIHSPY